MVDVADDLRESLRLAAIVDSSADAIISKDLQGIVQTWNPAAERIFGFTAEEMIGQSIRRLIPDNLQQEEDHVLGRIRCGERVEHYETTRQRKDGSLVPVSLTVSPVRTADGTVIGASKIARDISERKRGEEERQRLLGIAQEASRLKDEFLATLSHELRTPLNAIVGYVRMMQSGLLTADRQDRALSVVARNATSLTQIIEDVLDVSRIISGKLRLHVRAVDVPDIVIDAVETVRPGAEAKGLQVETILDRNVPAVSGDPERIQQILWNLLSNAVKFTERGGCIQVRIEQAASHVEISVSDTGIGIPAKFLPHVFERFRQADAGITREHGGLGLGLAITRHLVELQGGRIAAASGGPGKGATFCIQLPVRIVPTEQHIATPNPVAPERQRQITVPRLEGIRVLAVDDDADALALVCEILESTGATVTTADSAQAALDTIARGAPDVLIADIGMPRMDGLELIDRVRQSTETDVRAIQAAALTAYARSEECTRALRSGFQMHLAKPIDPVELMAAVAALAGRRGAGTSTPG